MSWDSVRGHDLWRQRFERVEKRGRLAHAYLFVGPQGVGKRLFALELAKTLSCESPNGFAACDACPACAQIHAGTHPDVQLVGKPSEKLEFPIDLIREVTASMGLKPARGRRRIIILDDVDQMSDDAAHAFLKSLEEPPPHSLIILIGQTTDHFFPTIVSRCQVIRFEPLPNGLIEEWLLAEKAVATAPQAKQVAELASGSMGLARQLADPEILAFRKDWLEHCRHARINSVTLAAKVNEFVDAAGADASSKRQRAQLALRFLADELSRFMDSDEQIVSLTSLLKRTELILQAEVLVDRRVQLVLLLEAFAEHWAEPISDMV